MSSDTQRISRLPLSTGKDNMTHPLCDQRTFRKRTDFTAVTLMPRPRSWDDVKLENIMDTVNGKAMSRASLEDSFESTQSLNGSSDSALGLHVNPVQNENAHDGSAHDGSAHDGNACSQAQVTLNKSQTHNGTHSKLLVLKSPSSSIPVPVKLKSTKPTKSKVLQPIRGQNFDLSLSDQQERFGPMTESQILDTSRNSVVRSEIRQQNQSVASEALDWSIDSDSHVSPTCCTHVSLPQAVTKFRPGPEVISLPSVTTTQVNDDLNMKELTHISSELDHNRSKTSTQHAKHGLPVYMVTNATLQLQKKDIDVPKSKMNIRSTYVQNSSADLSDFSGTKIPRYRPPVSKSSLQRQLSGSCNKLAKPTYQRQQSLEVNRLRRASSIPRLSRSFSGSATDCQSLRDARSEAGSSGVGSPVQTSTPIPQEKYPVFKWSPDPQESRSPRHSERSRYRHQLRVNQITRVTSFV